jgi:competence protein ComEC
LLPKTFFLCTACVISLCLGQSAAHAASSLQIYWIDVEGGGATLIVSPSGESMLVDVGNPPPAGERDTKRIYQAIQLAGLKKIDYLFVTHYDGDHVGGVLPLSKMIRIEKFVDHGDIDAAWNQNPHYEDRWQDYLSASSNRRMIVNLETSFL